MQNPMLGPLPRPSTDALNRTLDQFEARVRAAGGTSSRPDKEELKKVAHEFESLFVSYLLKVMRETIEESDSGEGGYGKGIYTELFDEEMSRTIARQGTFGIADLLIKRLSGEAEPAGNTAEKPVPDRQAPPKVSPATVPSPQESGPEPDSDISDVHLPVMAPVSSAFGVRRDPFTRQLRFHKGMDLAAPQGTEVRTALEGEVVFAGFKSGYGNTVTIKHADGLETTYAHLADVNVRKGDTIASEQVLGIVGNTGRSTGPHLHFEVSRWGEPLDPTKSLAE